MFFNKKENRDLTATFLCLRNNAGKVYKRTKEKLYATTQLKRVIIVTL